MRITGLATGLDVDEVVKTTLQPYRNRVDKVTQNKEIVEIKQKLYRDIMSDAASFYDKYLDITKSGSILKSSNYKSIVFSSSNESIVNVKAGSSAKAGNYTVTGTKATAAKAVVDDSILTEVERDGVKYKKITVNGKEFEVKSDTHKNMADDLNKQLKNAGINVSIRYSNFAGSESSGNKTGFIFESTVLGENGSFTIGGNSVAIGNKVDGTDAKGASVTNINFTMEKVLEAKEITIGDTKIDLSGIEDDKYSEEEDRVKFLNDKIKEYNLSASIDESGQITFTSTKLGSESESPKVKIGSIVGDDYTSGKDATVGTNTVKLSDIEGKSISINGNVIDLSKANGDVEGYINKIISEQNLKMSISIEGDNLTFTSKITGASSTMDIRVIDNTSGDLITSSEGDDANLVIKDDKGGVYKHEGNTNTITLDDITFSITGDIPAEGISVVGKTDVKETKDMLVNFVNDYNTLIEKLNSLTMTKNDKSYAPLTSDQKKEMSESEIKLWNERVEKGQLYKDTNLTRIINSMKTTMRSVMEGTGLSLETIGIEPVKDYSGTKNGTFSINEDKLTEALENNMDEVMRLFTANPADANKNDITYNSKVGIAHQLKSILYDEFKSSSSTLSKKVGIEGTSTFSNNELSRSISNYERKIKDLEKDISKREQTLYSKYATLETMMNKLNSQQSNLLSQLGMS
ncbi:flagellar filament capping protein FliD [Clostridium paraputrificum]|uniref:flagellar filament capping protein FliD n=1 Tax=Clostridium paraputrificum TaxID=29363 RepID=UPI000665A493|nr:flagellar filament capping protein FliD [Clostridium paraputrificum]MDB2105232.1 flagellar filament capping protein FliD [Clostridium paraputrificum]MDB2112279.1 flagellar filament capping protein FliD [Clostridium paraputrificum]